MEKINVAELLKDCPKGMELDCTIWDNVVFDHIDMKSDYPIHIKKMGGEEYLTEEGCFNFDLGAKCVIFPKGKTTWEGFQRPYINGDIVYTIGGSIAILGDKIGECSVGFYSHCGLFYDEFDFDIVVSPERLATEEEKEQLFRAIQNNGYKWNSETKTLEKLIVPKFNVDDRVRHKSHTREVNIVKEIKDAHYILDDELALPFTFQDEYELVPNKLEKLVKPEFKIGDIIQDIDTYKVKITEINIDDECYGYESIIAKGIGSIPFNEQDNWKLVPKKFDINTLKPFESRVLVRNAYNKVWRPTIFGCYMKDKYEPFYVLGGTGWKQCIPYEGNEHLLGKTDDCDECFKTW